MDSKEAEAYLATAEDHLRDAELAFRAQRYALCAFLSASSAENATSSLVIRLGAKPSKKHRNSLVLYRLAQGAGSETRPRLLQLVDLMKTVEPHVTKTRYPLMRGVELVPPHQFYSKAIGEEAWAQAQKVMREVKLLLKHREADS